MTFAQHEKFLLKYKKYCSPDYLKIACPRFSNGYFYGLGQNTSPALAGEYLPISGLHSIGQRCGSNYSFSRSGRVRKYPNLKSFQYSSMSNLKRKEIHFLFVYGLFVNSSRIQNLIQQYRFIHLFTPSNFSLGGPKPPSAYLKVRPRLPFHSKSLLEQKRHISLKDESLWLALLGGETKNVRKSGVGPKQTSNIIKIQAVVSQAYYYYKDNYKLRHGFPLINKPESNTIKNPIILTNETNISILAKRQRFIRNSLKGILLVNFPEKEKNFLIKNLAAENKIPLITQSASLLLKDSRNMDDLLGVDDPIQILFDKVKTCIPCICFINNLDRIGKQRYEQEQKSLHWLNYSISLLINHDLVNKRETQADESLLINPNRQNEMIGSKSSKSVKNPINKPVFSTFVPTFGSPTDQRSVQMGLPFDKQIKEANFAFRSHNSKLTGQKAKLITSYYHRFPTWLSNFRPPLWSESKQKCLSLWSESTRRRLISHYKTNIRKARWFGFYNNVYTPPKVIFYLESSASIAWKLWVLDKSSKSSIKINFFQTLSSKIKPVSKKPESKTIIAEASKLKTQTWFVTLRLKQQTAEKSLRFLSISDRLHINSLYSRLLFINCFGQAKQVQKQKRVFTHDSSTNSNELVFQNFLKHGFPHLCSLIKITFPVGRLLRSSNNLKMLGHKSEHISKINTNFIASSKNKTSMIASFVYHNKQKTRPCLKHLNVLNTDAKNEPLIPLNSFDSLDSNRSFLQFRFKPLNQKLSHGNPYLCSLIKITFPVVRPESKTKLGSADFNQWPSNPKLNSLDKNGQISTRLPLEVSLVGSRGGEAPKSTKRWGETQTKQLMSKQSQWDKILTGHCLKIFFSATVFDNAQARSRILFKRVLTKDTLNPNRQNITFKTNKSLIKNNRSKTSSLLTSPVREDNKNNSCELDR